MNEFIEIRFRRKGKPFPLKRQVDGGIEFDEPDPIERTVGVNFDAASPATRERMNSIRRVQGWDPGQFKLHVAVEDGALMLRGVNGHALPEGLYKLKVAIEEARTPHGLPSPASIARWPRQGGHRCGSSMSVVCESTWMNAMTPSGSCSIGRSSTMSRL